MSFSNPCGIFYDQSGQLLNGCLKAYLRDKTSLEIAVKDGCTDQWKGDVVKIEFYTKHDTTPFFVMNF